MSIFDDIINPIKGIADLASGIIKDFVPDPNQKLALQQQVLAAQTALQTKVLEQQTALTAAQAQIITAEATSSSWLEKDWRPIMLLFFGAVVGFAIFNGGYDLAGRAIPSNYVDAALTIVKIGVGGYIAQPVIAALKGNGNGANH